MAQRLIRTMDRSWYPEFGDRWDNNLFRSRITAVLRKDHLLLDLGAGAGILPQMDFRGLAARCCGVDPDARIFENPFLDEARVATGDSIPYPDAGFDVVISNNVLEHLEAPLAVFREVSRVLKPNGIFLAKTPNKMHYVPLISRITPHSFHAFINGVRGRSSRDTYPTYYRANTPSAIRRLAGMSGLKVTGLDLVEGRPEYMRMTALTYVLGICYERIVNSSDLFSGLRVVILAAMEKRC